MWVLGQQVWNGLLTGVAYSVFAVGLTLIFGVLRVINMAHGELYMLGGMLLYTITVYLHLDFFTATLLTAAALGTVGLIFDRIAIQPLLNAHPLSMMMSTMAVSVIVINLATIVWNVDTRVIDPPFQTVTTLLGVSMSHTSLVLCAMGAAAVTGLYLFLRRTTLGLRIRATNQDPIGAGLVGVNVKRMYALTMAMAAILAAVAGGMIGTVWVASPLMGQDILLKGFAVVIVGGLGNPLGAVVIGVGLGVTEAFFSQYVSTYYRDVYAFGLLIAACLFKPKGVFGSL